MSTDQKDNELFDNTPDEKAVPEDQAGADDMEGKITDSEIDLDKEIAELDDILNENAELAEEEISETEEFLTATSMKSSVAEESKGGLGKYVGYAAVLALLGGGAYAGLTYGPAFMKSPETDQFMNAIGNRSTDMIAGEVTAPTSILPQEQAQILSSESDIQNEADPLPMAVDSNEILPIDDGGFGSENNALLGFGEPEIVDSTDIAEAASTIDGSIKEISNDLAVEAEMSAAEVSEENIEVTQPEISHDGSIERIMAQPLKGNIITGTAVDEVIQQETIVTTEDLNPLTGKLFEQEQNIADVPIEALENMVDETPVVVADQVNEVLLDNDMAESVPLVVETVQVESVKSTEKKTVETPIATLPTPVSPVKKAEPARPADPRLEEARVAMSEENFVSALVLYNAILADDPANTAALTGQKMAQAKVNTLTPQAQILSDTVIVTEADQLIMTPQGPIEDSVVTVTETTTMQIGDEQIMDVKEIAVETETVIGAKPTVADLVAEIARYDEQLAKDPGNVEILMAKQIAEAKLRIKRLQEETQSVDDASLLIENPVVTTATNVMVAEEVIVTDDKSNVTATLSAQDIEMTINSDTPMITEQVTTVDMTATDNGQEGEILVNIAQETGQVDMANSLNPAANSEAVEADITAEAEAATEKKIVSTAEPKTLHPEAKAENFSPSAATSEPQGARSLEQEVAQYDAILAADPNNVDALVAKELAEAKLRLEVIQGGNRPASQTSNVKSAEIKEISTPAVAPVEPAIEEIDTKTVINQPIVSVEETMVDDLAQMPYAQQMDAMADSSTAIEMQEADTARRSMPVMIDSDYETTSRFVAARQDIEPTPPSIIETETQTVVPQQTVEQASVLEVMETPERAAETSDTNIHEANIQNEEPAMAVTVQTQSNVSEAEETIVEMTDPVTPVMIEEEVMVKNTAMPEVSEEVNITEAETNTPAPIKREDITFGARVDPAPMIIEDAEVMVATTSEIPTGPVAVETKKADAEIVPISAEVASEPVVMDEPVPLIANDKKDEPMQVAALPQPTNVPVAPKVEDIMMWDDEPVAGNSVSMELRPTNMTLQNLLQRAEDSPRDAFLAIQVGDAYRSAGERDTAEEWYRKALQLDVLYDSNIDRMMVYDRLAGVR